MIFALFVLTNSFVFAQPKIKNVLVEGNGAPIVLLPGGTIDISAYEFHAKELSGNNKIIRLEHFNVQYGSAGLMLPRNYSVKVESEAVKYTLDSLQVKEPIVLMGHSYGGLIALDFAINYPERIRALILIEPPAFGMARAKKESPAGLENIQQVTKELTPNANITEALVERFRCALLNCDSISIRNHSQWATWVKQKNRMRGLSAVADYKINFKKLNGFEKPVLIITGTETVPFHRQIDELLAKEFRNAKSISIPGGHAVPTTAPKEVIKSILDFINNL